VSARILDGTAVAAAMRADLGPRVAAFTERAGRPPGLGIVLVGTHAPSEIYVRNKLKAASEIGCRADLVRLPDTATLPAILEAVASLNHSPDHDGILVQDPLPDGLGPGAAQAVFDSIDPEKDVDGFTPVNAGRLLQGRARLAPCTPSGVIELLDRSGIAVAGAHAVVIGRSDIVGKPMALLLLHRHATVTICHSRTKDLRSITRQADLLVAAVGRPAFVRNEHVRPGATVIDVGINRLTSRDDVHAIFPEGSTKRADFERRGAVLVGDVHPEVAEVAGALTPVPGGVGPLTIAQLLTNTVAAAEGRAGWSGSR
jgi:methylenetetrahydrofolate dehydrogenase (NADP+)/methenyltetrahydrofolate cyclohydrolase